MINEKSCWPIFRLAAGSTTLAAAICISGDNYLLTNILNLTSTHLYLVDSLTLFRKEMCCAVYPTDSGKWVKKYLLFGDLTYFAGSAIDVPVRQMRWTNYSFMGCLSFLTTLISTSTFLMQTTSWPIYGFLTAHHSGTILYGHGHWLGVYFGWSVRLFTWWHSSEETCIQMLGMVHNPNDCRKLWFMQSAEWALKEKKRMRQLMILAFIIRC